MTGQAQEIQPFNVVIVGQAGRLQYEAILFCASLRANSPGFTGRLIVAEPQPGPLWQTDPRMRGDETQALLQDLDAEILPFETRHFGQAYPYGNKIELLAALPEGEPFVFFDTDTLVTGDLAAVPFDFERPSASLRRGNRPSRGPPTGERSATHCPCSSGSTCEPREINSGPNADRSITSL